ncbi:MAG: hypothetical protein VKJ06_07470 [Vampirovibrionales bacterium]|nr:hypothetical protein [Vampirovibrionales bacterium]
MDPLLERSLFRPLFTRRERESKFGQHYIELLKLRKAANQAQMQKKVVQSYQSAPRLIKFLRKLTGQGRTTYSKSVQDYLIKTFATEASGYRLTAKLLLQTLRELKAR